MQSPCLGAGCSVAEGRHSVIPPATIVLIRGRAVTGLGDQTVILEARKRAVDCSGAELHTSKGWCEAIGTPA